MKRNIFISDNEKSNILKQHDSLYDGYSVRNQNSNMTPLKIHDPYKDKQGVTVNSKGEVMNYQNHKINEITAKPLNYDEIEPAYEFVSDGPQQSMTQMGMGKRPYNFVSKGPSDVFNEDEEEEEYKIDENLFGYEVYESVNETLKMFKKFKKYN